MTPGDRRSSADPEQARAGGRPTALGRLLQARREALGYSRPALGEAAGVSPGTIEGWELGRVGKPPIHDVLRLARYLRIPLTEVEAAVLEGEDLDPLPATSKKESKRPGRTRRGGEPGRALLQRGVELFQWDDDIVAELLETSPERVRAWRTGEERMGASEMMSLTAIFSTTLSHADRLGRASSPAAEGS